MAPIKRKREDSTGSAPVSKKSRPLNATAKLSMLKEEEPSFPRGGASVLTPLEHKQIQRQAQQDVLFEQKTGTKPTKHDFEDEWEDDEAVQVGPAPVSSKRKSKPNIKETPKGGSRAPEIERGMKIEGLSYKVGVCDDFTMILVDCVCSGLYLALWSLVKSSKLTDTMLLWLYRTTLQATYP